MYVVDPQFNPGSLDELFDYAKSSGHGIYTTSYYHGMPVQEDHWMKGMVPAGRVFGLLCKENVKFEDDSRPHCTK
jgi:hypothetical protein